MKSTAKKATFKKAGVLSFSGKLVNSDAMMTSGIWGDRNNENGFSPVLITEKSVRGTISNRLKSPLSDDPAKIDAEVKKANLQTVDSAALPFEHDTLKVVFTLRVLGDVATPSVCDEPEYQAAAAEIVNEYAQSYRFAELASRYATNVANGRFLWRNRVGAEAVEVHVQHGDQNWVFDAQEIPMDTFPAATGDLKAFSEAIRQGLSGEKLAAFTVTAFVKLMRGQTVYPSQELVRMDDRGDKKNTYKKSKFLYQLGGVAAMHSQKIGNALRTIDTWHNSVEEVGPISVEPYGSVTSRGRAYRQPTDAMDFYKLWDKWIMKGEAPDVEQQHFVMAVLIRGGVFGG